MANNYVATIMDRIFLGDDNYLFVHSHTVTGTLDPKTKMFKDRNGNEYFSIIDPYALRSESSKGYANLEKMDELPKKTGCARMSDAIADYDYLMRTICFYVSTLENNEVFYIPINLDNMKNSLREAMNKVEEQGGLEKVAEEQKKNPPKVQEQPGKEKASHLFTSDMQPEIAAILMNIQDGVYSLEDLKKLRKNVAIQKDDIEGLLDSLELQIEASEKGESSIKLRGEKERPKATIEIPKEKQEEKPKEKIKVPNYIDIEDLFKKITKTLIAQDEPTRRVLTEIARKFQSKMNNDRGILITGQTGSGKTKMMELVARYLDRPFLKVDSTQLTIPGYVGKDIEEVLWDLYVKCGKDKNKAEHAIIFFDEIDKKGSSRKDDISGKGVLNVLLPFFDGATYDACESVKFQKEVVKINTRDMLVILGGAFEDVYKDLKVKLGMGFSASNEPAETTRKAQTQDFVEKAQMPSEFMGRVAIVKLNDLTVQDIKRILLESDESALRIQEKLFKELGVKLTPSEEYIDAIAEQAEKRKTGARGLNTVVDESTWEAYGDAYTHLGEYEEIILGKETIEDPKQYQKVYKKRDNQ